MCPIPMMDKFGEPLNIGDKVVFSSWSDDLFEGTIVEFHDLIDASLISCEDGGLRWATSYHTAKVRDKFNRK